MYIHNASYGQTHTYIMCVCVFFFYFPSLGERDVVINFLYFLRMICNTNANTCVCIHMLINIYTHMCVCVCVYMYVCIYIYIFIYTCMHIYIYMHINTYEYTYRNINLRTKTCTCICIYGWSSSGACTQIFQACRNTNKYIHVSRVAHTCTSRQASPLRSVLMICPALCRCSCAYFSGEGLGL